MGRSTRDWWGKLTSSRWAERPRGEGWGSGRARNRQKVPRRSKFRLRVKEGPRVSPRGTRRGNLSSRRDKNGMMRSRRVHEGLGGQACVRRGARGLRRGQEGLRMSRRVQAEGQGGSRRGKLRSSPGGDMRGQKVVKKCSGGRG